MAQPEKISGKYGMSPGSLVYTGEKDTKDPVIISLIDYNEHELIEKTGVSLGECEGWINRDSVSWINISGIHNTDVIESLGNMLHLHPLLLEDVLNTRGRPKIDDYEQYLFIVLKMLDYRLDADFFDYEHVCLIVQNGVVISLQEHEGDVFCPLRERIRRGRGRIRKSGADYLAYALMDMIVDHYFQVLEGLGEKIEEYQDAVIDDPDPSVLEAIHAMKRQVIHIRKTVWPVREIAATLLRGESEIVGKETQLYIRDVYDHTVQVVETVEVFRELLASVLDIYLSSVSNKMSEVMKVLTVIATIFIPLTFFAGVYGMNFVYMPELEWRYAYPAVWSVFIAIGAGMIAWFKYKKWL